MALNQRYARAEKISLTATKDIKSGDPVKIGNITGVAQISAKSGEKVTVWLVGSYMLTVGQKVNEGQQVNIAANGTLTTGAGDPFGVALVATAAAGEAEIAPFGITPAIPAAGGE